MTNERSCFRALDCFICILEYTRSLCNDIINFSEDTHTYVAKKIWRLDNFRQVWIVFELDGHFFRELLSSLVVRIKTPQCYVSFNFDVNYFASNDTFSLTLFFFPWPSSKFGDISLIRGPMLDHCVLRICKNVTKTGLNEIFWMIVVNLVYRGFLFNADWWLLWAFSQSLVLGCGSSVAGLNKLGKNLTDVTFVRLRRRCERSKKVAAIPRMKIWYAKALA